MQLNPLINIGNRKVGADQPAYIIAELSANHNQDLDVAIASVHAIAESGADAIKVQTYTADSMTLDIRRPNFMAPEETIWAGSSLYDLYTKGALPRDWHQQLMELSISLGLDFFSSPFDIDTVDFLDQLNVPAFKVASLEINDIPLIRHMATKGKPIILSNGMADIADMDLAIQTCLDAGNSQLAMLQCTTQYPAEAKNTHLKNIVWIHKHYGMIAGLSDHSMGITAAIASIGLGCKIIEKHFTLDKSMDTLDDKFSLDPIEFKSLVVAVREAELMMGQDDYVYSDIKQRARGIARSLIATEDIPAGAEFTAQNIRSLRPGIGLPPKYFDSLLGRIASKPITRGDGLSWDVIEGGES